LGKKRGRKQEVSGWGAHPTTNGTTRNFFPKRIEDGEKFKRCKETDGE